MLLEFVGIFHPSSGISPYNTFFSSACHFLHVVCMSVKAFLLSFIKVVCRGAFVDLKVMAVNVPFFLTLRVEF